MSTLNALANQDKGFSGFSESVHCYTIPASLCSLIPNVLDFFFVKNL